MEEKKIVRLRLNERELLSTVLFWLYMLVNGIGMMSVVLILCSELFK